MGVSAGSIVGANVWYLDLLFRGVAGQGNVRGYSFPECTHRLVMMRSVLGWSRRIQLIFL